MEGERAVDTDATEEWTKHVAERIHIANSQRPNAESVAGDSHHLCGYEESRKDRSAEPNRALCTTDSPASLRPGEPSTLGVTTLRVDDGTSMRTSVKVGQGQTVVSEMPLSDTRLDCSALAGSTAPQADPVYKWRQDVGLKDPQQEVTRYKQRTDNGLLDSQQQCTGDASDTNWSVDDIIIERTDTQMLATSCDSTHL